MDGIGEIELSLYMVVKHNRLLSKIAKRTYHLRRFVKHVFAQATRRYYFEDDMRVHPEYKDNNFLNHAKFYRFASQFVKDKRVADVGCGYGYGCEILKGGGASFVGGSDMSKKCIKYASGKYRSVAEFRIQGITELKEYADNSFDVTVSSKVLEHIKEYGKEELALKELQRITRDKGLIIIGTPNSEMLGDHGFYLVEVRNLFGKLFSEYCVFENALVPFGNKKALWEERLSNGNVGIIVSQNIRLTETVLPNWEVPELKRGMKPGIYRFVNYDIDTALLHNTHSWIIVTINNK